MVGREGLAFLILFLILLLNLNGICQAGEVKAEILQYKLDRFYIDIGSENYIFKGCNYWVIQDEDTICSGKIEEVYEGICISEKTLSFFDSVSIDSVFALIETADIDSSSQIKIGNSIWKENEFRALISSNFETIMKASWNVNDIGNPIYIDHMFIINKDVDFSGDGMLSYHKTDNFSKYRYEISTSAPFIVVLIPNLSKEINRSGMLTTSLYYRFDDNFLPYIFPGDNLRKINCLFPADSSYCRAYEYDSEKGRQIANNIRKNYTDISIGYQGFDLEKNGNFFADILSRDKFTITTLMGYNEAEINIVFIPYNSRQPDLSLISIVDLLTNQDPLYQSQKEILNIIKSHLESAREAQTDILREYYLKLVDYSLKYDLGVFPLFQPTIYFQYNQTLTNCRFDENGNLDWKALTKLKLPSSVTGDKK